MDLEAFVVQSLEYKDHHKILYTYTPKGHQSVLAYHVKKMKSLSRHLSQRGNLIQYSAPKKELGALKDASLINEYETLKNDPIKYTYMLHILELVRHVIDDGADHEKMFSFLKKIFKFMNSGRDCEFYTFIFELKLLYFIGYGLNLNHCVRCEKQDNLVFHPSSGGLTCPHHVKDLSRTYTMDIALKVKHLYQMDVSKESPFDISPRERLMIRRLIDDLYEEFVSYKTKSSQILKQFKKT